MLSDRSSVRDTVDVGSADKVPDSVLVGDGLDERSLVKDFDTVVERVNSFESVAVPVSVTSRLRDMETEDVLVGVCERVTVRVLVDVKDIVRGCVSPLRVFDGESVEDMVKVNVLDFEKDRSSVNVMVSVSVCDRDADVSKVFDAVRDCSCVCVHEFVPLMSNVKLFVELKVAVCSSDSVSVTFDESVMD